MHALIFCRFVALVLCASATARGAVIDDSVGIFFPPALKDLQYSQTEFPVFWWNFAVIDPRGGEANFSRAGEVCGILKHDQPSPVGRVVCGDDLGEFTRTLADWSGDMVLREPFDAKNPQRYRRAISETLSAISLLGTANQEIFQLLRHDPLNQWQDYLRTGMSMIPPGFRRERGLLLDGESRRLIIPVQFAVTPKMKNVAALMQDLEKFPDVHLVGAHASAFANESQVHVDLDRVSLVGVTVLALFILLLVVKGRVGALLLFPPVALAMTLAAAVTALIDGSIHGLTLAFGSGIVGLAIDYGLHGAFNSASSRTWRSNLIGLLTTLAGLLVLAFSGVPLIRQMMIFASIGIALGCLFFYLVCRYFPRYFCLKPIHLPFPEFRGSWVVILGLIIAGIAGALRANPTFDLRRFNYAAEADAAAANWFFGQAANRETFLLLHAPQDFPEASADEKRWADDQKIHYEGLGNSLPRSEAQTANETSWIRGGCPDLRRTLPATALKIFGPFMNGICEARPIIASFAALTDKNYLRPFVGKDKFISLLMSEDSAQESAIRQKFIGIHSLADSVRGFADSLRADLRWMIPLSMALCTAILALYYRRWKFVLISYIPFLSGLGLFTVAEKVSGETVDLISVLGLVMVFGFSVDYGIFVTDIFAFRQPRDRLPVVQMILLIAALTNVIGFFPMLFARHPVLHQLGFALFFGTSGTFLGTRWGLPWILNLVCPKEELV